MAHPISGRGLPHSKTLRDIQAGTFWQRIEPEPSGTDTWPKNYHSEPREPRKIPERLSEFTEESANPFVYLAYFAVKKCLFLLRVKFLPPRLFRF